jgi:xanthine dehydrogenase accessory factor
MRDVITELESWWKCGETVGVGTAVKTWNSAPRQAGSAVIVGPDGTVPTVQRYGVSSHDACTIGLTCGGTIDIFVGSVNQETFPQLDEVARAIRDGRPVAVATVF